MEDVSPYLCTPEDKSYPKWDEIEQNLQLNSSRESKIDALEKLIRYQVSGEQPPETVIMTVITNVSPSKDHQIKKLLFLYYEIIETRDRKGNLKQEFILICDAIIKDLNHRNEYIRSAVLRFISRFQEKELVQQFVSSVAESLTHKSAYVRRHAVVAIGRIHQRWPDLAPDAPQDIAEVLKNEEDSACKRVAFLVLCDISRDLAAEFLDEILEGSVLKLSQPMQLTAVSLIKNLCSDKRKNLYLPSLLELLESQSTAVKIEAAVTLLNLTASPTASSMSFTTLCHIMQTIPNASLQLSIVEQIEKFIPSHTAIAQKIVGDLIISMKAKAIRTTVLKMVKELATTTNVSDIVSGLLTQLESQKRLRTKENEAKDAILFMKNILTTFRSIAASFPAILAQVYDAIRSFITDYDGNLSYEAMMLIRDYAHLNENKADEICEQIENILPFIPNPKIIRCASYLISLKTKRPESVDAIIDAYFQREKEALAPENAKDGVTTTTVIGKDGTYVTEYQAEQKESPKPVWFANNANIFVVTTVSIALARICCRIPEADSKKCLAFVEQILQYPNAAAHEKRLLIAHSAIVHCKDKSVSAALVDAAEEAYDEVIEETNKELAVKQADVEEKNYVDIDQKLSFGALLGRRFDSPSTVNKHIETKQLNLVQITGNSDPLFCEVNITHGKFDISVELRLLNQTVVTLRNIRVELSVSGKLEIVDRPALINLASNTSDTVFFSVKVTSAEAGRIYGDIIFEVDDHAGRQCIPISPISITPQNYMEPLVLDQATYRNKWDSFEWEKKMTIKTKLAIPEFIDLMCETGRMHMMNEIDKEASFVTVNLCSTSFFDEETLLNVSLENRDGKAEGYMRLRCASHSMALAYSRLLLSADA
jgi:coatomer subunit beta